MAPPERYRLALHFPAAAEPPLLARLTELGLAPHAVSAVPGQDRTRVQVLVAAAALADTLGALKDALASLRHSGALRGAVELSVDDDPFVCGVGPVPAVRVAGFTVVRQPTGGAAPILLRPAAAGDITIPLALDDAFGDGRHPSTALCLALLRSLRDGPCPLAVRRVLDVGCGTGILSLAALALWPDATAAAVDTDPGAYLACQTNAAAAGVGSRVEVRLGSVDGVVGPFDLILANLTHRALRVVGDALIDRLAPGGRIIIAGFIESHAPLCLGWFAARGVLPVAVRGADGWSAAVLGNRGRALPEVRSV